MTANPFAAVPPPQTMAPGNVQINYDDDDILMDYDDEPQGPIPAAAMNGNGAGDQMMEVETTGSTLEDVDQLALEKVYLRGVDSMSTGNVKAFVSEHFTEAEIAKVEWIDDSSCNLVYSSPEDALSALNALQTVIQEFPVFTLRPAKSASTHPDSHLEVRIATQNDRKVKGARDRSRYYLFHPEEDRLEKLERQRRDTRRPDRRRYTDSADDDDTRDYERRYYDEREHSRRRDGASVEVYTDNFYDDAPRRREHSSSRDRSCSPGRERARRQRSPIELFPERRSREPMEAYPAPERRREQRELFPERAGPSRGSREEGYESGRLKNEPVELFPIKPAASSGGPRFRSERSAPLEERIELFPEKVAPRGNRRPAALENRITMPARSLEERITLERSSADNSAGEREGGGFKIKGRGRDMGGGDDLFAEKLRAVKGEGLVIDSYDRRKSQKRNRAEDMFG